MDLDLKGKIALVAGGNKGFGEACAHRLASEGAKLLLTARNKADLENVAADIRGKHGTDVTVLAQDLLESDGGDKAVAATLGEYGRLDIMISSVGASGGGIFWEIPDEVWMDSFALKFMANLRMMRAAVHPMREQKSGRMVVIVGQLGVQPHPRILPSSTANAALLSAVKGLADEVASDGVIVNAVNPGPSRTERWNRLMDNVARDTGQTVDEVEAGFTKDIPLGRFGEPDEIARHVCFLASEAAGYMTGTSLNVEGGWIKAPG